MDGNEKRGTLASNVEECDVERRKSADSVTGPTRRVGALADANVLECPGWSVPAVSAESSGKPCASYCGAGARRKQEVADEQAVKGRGGKVGAHEIPQRICRVAKAVRNLPRRANPRRNVV